MGADVVIVETDGLLGGGTGELPLGRLELRHGVLPLLDARERVAAELSAPIVGVGDGRRADHLLCSLPAAAQRLALVDADCDKPEIDVRDLLDVGKSGKPTPSLLNAYTVLSKDTRWQGRLRWSTFEEVLHLDGKPFDDNETTRISLWLDRIYMLRIASENLVRAVNHVAMERPFHPIREWMDGLAWDGTPRIDGLISTYLRGLPTELNARLSRAWMIAAVARIYEPGCKGRA